MVLKELDSHWDRQPKMDSLATSITKNVSAAVIHIVKTTPPTRSVAQMTKAEVTAPVGAALGYRKIRELLTEVLSRRITAISKNGEGLCDFCTISFRASSKKRKNYANSEFDKALKSLVHKLYEQNGVKEEEQQPLILRNNPVCCCTTWKTSTTIWLLPRAWFCTTDVRRPGSSSSAFSHVSS